MNAVSIIVDDQFKNMRCNETAPESYYYIMCISSNL